MGFQADIGSVTKAGWKNKFLLSLLFLVENGKVKCWEVYADWTEDSRIIKEDKEMAKQAVATDGARRRC